MKNDRPGYSCERTQWVLVTGAEPLNCLPACVLGRFPFDGMKPTFRHRRTEAKMRMNKPASNKEKPQIRQAGSAEAFVGFLPLAGNNLIFSAASASVKPSGLHHSTFNLPKNAYQPWN